jgi:hypothetical protein
MLGLPEAALSGLLSLISVPSVLSPLEEISSSNPANPQTPVSSYRVLADYPPQITVGPASRHWRERRDVNSVVGYSADGNNCMAILLNDRGMPDMMTT